MNEENTYAYPAQNGINNLKNNSINNNILNRNHEKMILLLHREDLNVVERISQIANFGKKVRNV